MSTVLHGQPGEADLPCCNCAEGRAVKNKASYLFTACHGRGFLQQDWGFPLLRSGRVSISGIRSVTQDSLGG